MIGISRSASGSWTILPTIGRVARVGGVHRDRAVAEHGLGPGGGDGDVVAGLAEGDGAVGVLLDVLVGLAAGERVLEVPHVARDLDVLDLEVGDRGLEVRVPVDQALAAEDQAAVVELDEGPQHRVVEARVHGEARCARGRSCRRGGGTARGWCRRTAPSTPRPWRRRPRGPSRGGRRCRPSASSRSTTIWVAMPAWSRPGCQRVSKPRIRCQRVSDVHQRVVEGVAHVQAAGDVRRRQQDAEGPSCRRAGPGVGAGAEGSRGLPAALTAGSAVRASKVFSMGIGRGSRAWSASCLSAGGW